MKRGEDLRGGAALRRLSTISGGLAFFWACAVSLHVLRASSPTGITVSAAIAGVAGEAATVAPPLDSADGVWVTGLLLIISVLSGVPLAVTLTYPPGQSVTAWTIGSILVGFSVLAGLSLGLPYLPSALLIFMVGVLAKREATLRVLGSSGWRF